MTIRRAGGAFEAATNGVGDHAFVNGFPMRLAVGPQATPFADVWRRRGGGVCESSGTPFLHLRDSAVRSGVRAAIVG